MRFKCIKGLKGSEKVCPYRWVRGLEHCRADLNVRSALNRSSAALNSAQGHGLFMELYFHDAELYFAIGHADAVELTRVAARQLLDFTKGSAVLRGT